MKISKNFVNDKFCGTYTVELGGKTYENVVQSTIDAMMKVLKEFE